MDKPKFKVTIPCIIKKIIWTIENHPPGYLEGEKGKYWLKKMLSGILRIHESA